MPDIANGICRA